MSFLSTTSDDSCDSLEKLNIVDEEEEPMDKPTDNAVLKLMSQSPLYQGYLFKESSFHKAFNKRYFVLYQDLLVYYREEDQFLKRSAPEARLVSIIAEIINFIRTGIHACLLWVLKTIYNE